MEKKYRKVLEDIDMVILGINNMYSLSFEIRFVVVNTQ